MGIQDTENWQLWLLGLRTTGLNPCENDLCKLYIKPINLLALFIFLSNNKNFAFRISNFSHILAIT